MEELTKRLDSILQVVQDEEVIYKDEYILSELRNIFKDKEIIEAIYKDLKEML